jgi:hypothetical protein
MQAAPKDGNEGQDLQTQEQESFYAQAKFDIKKSARSVENLPAILLQKGSWGVLSRAGVGENRPFVLLHCTQQHAAQRRGPSHQSQRFDRKSHALVPRAISESRRESATWRSGRNYWEAILPLPLYHEFRVTKFSVPKLEERHSPNLIQQDVFHPSRS